MKSGAGARRKYSTRLLLPALIFGLGVFLGPLLVAVIAGLAAPAGDDARWRAAHRLLATHDDRFPEPPRLSTVDWQASARDCGYDFETLFGELPPLAEGRSWSPYAGLFDLEMAERAEFRDQVERLRVEELHRQFGAFELAFLDMCLERFLVARLCGSPVQRVLRAADLESPDHWPGSLPGPNVEREKRTMCTYLDGVAARNGLALAPRGRAQVER